ncbi:hypothetical protein K470DRAFT_271614 [Piedraia hortae CBS 480.64]|uniref:Uncharacterized protein n=1 Tax=Piedraia hortae CBS 480.64 TaxID=1314780 RepID=A0A6A7BWD5_9PEZI|nr:hypothetical protein K470DRAFT_271614 [Piedraia hortae CBS 480.64]
MALATSDVGPEPESVEEPGSLPEANGAKLVGLELAIETALAVSDKVPTSTEADDVTVSEVDNAPEVPSDEPEDVSGTKELEVSGAGTGVFSMLLNEVSAEAEAVTLSFREEIGEKLPPAELCVIDKSVTLALSPVAVNAEKLGASGTAVPELLAVKLTELSDGNEVKESVVLALSFGTRGAEELAVSGPTGPELPVVGIAELSDDDKVAGVALTTGGEGGKLAVSRPVVSALLNDVIASLQTAEDAGTLTPSVGTEDPDSVASELPVEESGGNDEVAAPEPFGNAGSPALAVDRAVVGLATLSVPVDLSPELADVGANELPGIVAASAGRDANVGASEPSEIGDEPADVGESELPGTTAVSGRKELGAGANELSDFSVEPAKPVAGVEISDSAAAVDTTLSVPVDETASVDTLSDAVDNVFVAAVEVTSGDHPIADREASNPPVDTTSAILAEGTGLVVDTLAEVAGIEPSIPAPLFSPPPAIDPLPIAVVVGTATPTAVEDTIPPSLPADPSVILAVATPTSVGTKDPTPFESIPCPFPTPSNRTTNKPRTSDAISNNERECIHGGTGMTDIFTLRGAVSPALGRAPWPLVSLKSR